MPGCLGLLLLLGLPVFDVWLLFRIGAAWGGWNVAGLVLLTTLLGLSLARGQRVRALAAASRQVASGKLPGAALADAPMLMLAAVLFAIPGFVTDALGLLLLVPPLRRVLFVLGMRRVMAAAREGRVNVRVFGGVFGAPGAAGPAGPTAAAGPGGTPSDAGGFPGVPFEPSREIKDLPAGSVRVHREPERGPARGRELDAD